MKSVMPAALLSVLLATRGLLAPGLELTIGEPQIVTEARGAARPAAAFGQSGYLVVWRTGWPGSGGAADILAARLEVGTLRRLDEKPIAVCTAADAQDAPQVAFHRGLFLVVWQDLRNGKDFDVFAALVDAKTGQVKRENIVIARGTGNQARPAVAQTAEGFLVVWQDWRGRGQYGVSSRRVSLTGELLEAEPQNIANLGARPAIAGSAGNLLVSWVTGTPRGVTSAALLSSRDGAIRQELGTIIPCCPNEPAVAADGRGRFVAVSARTPYPDPWGWGGPGAVVCVRVGSDGDLPEGHIKYNSSMLSERRVPNVIDAASWGNQPNGPWRAGAVGGFPGTHDGLWPRGWPTVAYSGGGLYLFGWVKGAISPDRLTLSRYDVWLRGIDGKSLEVRLPDLKVTSKEDVEQTRPALVAGPAGEVLLLCEEIAAERPRRVVARRLAPANQQAPRASHLPNQTI